MKHRSWYNGTFDFDLHLVWPVRPKQFRNYVRKVTGKRKYKSPGSFAGICHYHKSAAYVIIGLAEWKNTPINHGDLAHEALHAVRAMLMPRGIKLDRRTQEAYSYLIGWIVKETTKALNEK